MDGEKIKKKIMEKVAEYYKLKFIEQKFIPGESRIDPSGKLFDERELQNGVEAVLDGWWTEGRFGNEFRKKFGNYLGVENVILTNSGSSANLLALYCLTSPLLGKKRLMPGDEVITVAATFPTTVNPIIQARCTPVFLDIEDINSGQYNIDTLRLEEAITERTKAIFIAHTLGNPFNLEKVLEIKEKNNLWLIEDCCDALGSLYNSRKVGTFGDLATFSFYPAHHITMGEGGAVVTNDSKLKRIAESFRNWGRDCWCEPGCDDTCGKRFEWQLGDLPFGYDHKNTYTHLGFNFKITDMQAAIGLAQLDKLEEFIRRRKENFDYLHKGLESYKDKIILPAHLPEAEPSWFGFLVTVRERAGFRKEELERHLTERKIMTRSLFCGNITKQPLMRDIQYRVVGSLRNTDYVMNNTFWVGVQPNITDAKREYAAECFREFLESH